jgi:hypothetical protein
MKKLRAASDRRKAVLTSIDASGVKQTTMHVWNEDEVGVANLATANRLEGLEGGTAAAMRTGDERYTWRRTL